MERFYKQYKENEGFFQETMAGFIAKKDLSIMFSLLLNRLIFTQFIEKKGLLDHNTDYLAVKLRESRTTGKNRFYTDFLEPLFFEGFAVPEVKRGTDIQQILGKIPYVGGSLFSRHKTENRYLQLPIPDEVFERLFSFFAGYNWTLDKSTSRRDNDIDPELLSRIFEKRFSNKEMGAYYTRGDITLYIAGNTIIPRLLVKVGELYSPTRGDEKCIWEKLTNYPDRYLFPGLKKGQQIELPADIVAGLNNIKKRAAWNQAAPETYALPTETWREVIERQKYISQLTQKLKNGTAAGADDLITYNLDTRKFADDLITDCQDPLLLRIIWECLQEITILDPACGSGAFLLASLDILAPLYRACRQKLFGRNEKNFTVLKAILLQNLYGMDIMEEAAEFCKLRLSLELAGQQDWDAYNEPLPDLSSKLDTGDALDGNFFKSRNRRGFDILVGNPPYLEYSKNNRSYCTFLTGSCGNLAALILEQALRFTVPGGYCGMIVPISLISAEKMKPLQNILLEHRFWQSSYSNRPGKLFSSVEQRLTILLIHKEENPSREYYSTSYQHWYAAARGTLFANLRYLKNSYQPKQISLGKIGGLLQQQIIKKLYDKRDTLGSRLGQGESKELNVYFHDGPTYWIRAMSFLPNQGGTPLSQHYKIWKVAGEKQQAAVVCILNSTLFYLYYKTFSNCRDLSRREISSFPVGGFDEKTLAALAEAEKRLMDGYAKHKRSKTRNYPSGLVRYDEYYPALCKSIIDEIDRVLAGLFGFTGEELDYIIHYEEKYRLGAIGVMT